MEKKKVQKPSLTDHQLSAKYDTGKPVDMEKAVLKMAKGDSKTSKSKDRQKP